MRIETARLILREHDASDYDDLRALDSDVEVQRYRGDRIITEEQTRDWLQRMKLFQQEQPRQHFWMVMARKADGGFIGVCSLDITNKELHEAERGYQLKRQYWGQGYATEAGRALLEFGFKQSSLHRIWARANTANIGSWSVMQKLGMRREGHLREADRSADGESGVSCMCMRSSIMHGNECYTSLGSSGARVENTGASQ